MNRTKIEWTHIFGPGSGFSWNPGFGCNPKVEDQCPYCYGRLTVAPRLAHKCKLCGQYIWHQHRERLDDPFKRKKPAGIFVCSCADLFGNWVDPNFIEDVLTVVELNPQHIFFFLTKFPRN